MYKSLCLITALTLLLSCSKSDSPTPNPPPNPPQQPDTSYLATGWSKVQVNNSFLTDIAWIDVNDLVVNSLDTRQLISSNNGGLNWGPLPGFVNGDNMIATSNGMLSWTNAVNKSWVGRFKNGVIDSISMPGQTTDLFYLDASNGYASLTGSTGLAETHDGGDSWHATTTGITVPGNTYYATLFLLDSLHGLLSFGGHIFNTTSGIHHWQTSAVSNPPSDTYPCSKLFLANPAVAFAGFANGDLFRSDDSGRTFSLLPIQTHNSTPAWMDLQFFDADHGYACYNDVILKTSNGGAKWDTAVYMKGQKFIELEFLDQNHGACCTKEGAVYMYKQ